MNFWLFILSIHQPSILTKLEFLPKIEADRLGAWNEQQQFKVVCLDSIHVSYVLMPTYFDFHHYSIAKTTTTTSLAIKRVGGAAGGGNGGGGHKISRTTSCLAGSIS
ncbi:hypothetical protein DERF_008406 [Dermatophagoides farinae]|uniref:Uncharacterized protein n=1 Tax=Dermatophagoides farinae TaxID=6954 RepID=A0A922I0X0_DERFA|nr:hypothetical protein DERF_008406 [Dermatophagoides farinae]